MLRPATSRSLALMALALSILLPAALFAYLEASGVLDGNGERLLRLESSIEAMRAAPTPEVSHADLDKLTARMDGIEKTLAARAKRRQASVAAGQAPSPEGVDAALDQASRDAKEALARAKAAEGSAKSVEQAASRLETRLAALEGQLAAAEQQGSPTSRRGLSAASILVLSRAIETDLKNGSSYAGDLDALSRLGAAERLVEALRPFADKGAPSSSLLADGFEAELNAARERVAASGPPAGWWGRVTAMLGRLVRVHRVGADEPGTPAASVETALARGDVGGGLDAWNSLPVFEKGATPNSGARIKALADAYDAARRISLAALEAIQRSGSADNGG